MKSSPSRLMEKPRLQMGFGEVRIYLKPLLGCENVPWCFIINLKINSRMIKQYLCGLQGFLDQPTHRNGNLCFCPYLLWSAFMPGTSQRLFSRRKNAMWTNICLKSYMIPQIQKNSHPISPEKPVAFEEEFGLQGYSHPVFPMPVALI